MLHRRECLYLFDKKLLNLASNFVLRGAKMTLGNSKQNYFWQYRTMSKFEVLKSFIKKRLITKSSEFRSALGHIFAFSALTLLVWHQEEHSACKGWVMRCWCGYLSRAWCKWLHFTWVVDDAKCIVVTAVCASVCPSLAVFPNFCTDPDVTWGNGRACPLVVHIVGGYAIGAHDDSGEREMSASACTGSMPGLHMVQLMPLPPHRLLLH